MIHKFKSDISNIELPKKFTFPFYYTPHKLVEIAASELQDYLFNQNDFDYNFGVRDDKTGTPQGKMFGVLIVKNKEDKLYYLQAFSGKLGTLDTPKGFVPPVFDIYAKDSFYPEGEKQVDELTLKVKNLENDPALVELKKRFFTFKTENGKYS